MADRGYLFFNLSEANRQRMGERINEFRRQTADGRRQNGRWTADGRPWTMAGEAFEAGRRQTVNEWGNE